MAKKKLIKPARASVTPPAAKAKGINQPKHPVMVLFQRRNKAGELRWHQHILAANGRKTSGLTEPEGYPSLSAVKRAVKQDEQNRDIILFGYTSTYDNLFSKSWWATKINDGMVIIRKAKKTTNVKQISRYYK